MNTQEKSLNLNLDKRYHFSGDIENGFINGKPCISHEEVTRKIRRITETHIICECDRKFIINENLKIKEI